MADEQRMQAYGALIEQLLSCPQGEEANILQSHSDLVDAGLLTAMEQVAVYLDAQKNGNAQWLRGFAIQLAETMDLKLPVPPVLEAAREFLLETLQLVDKNNEDPQQVYSVWEKQLTHFNSDLLEVLPQVVSQLHENEAENPNALAHNLFVLGNLIREFSGGIRRLNLEIAITAYEQALQTYTCEISLEDWAKIQSNLARAYSNRICGEKAENIEYAIAACEKSLQVYTLDAFPEKWAGMQCLLSSLFRTRLLGDKADNLEAIIAADQCVLQVHTRDTFPALWAVTNNSLGLAYGQRIRGEEADNLEISIASHEKALQVYDRDTFPEEWALTQSCLAIAYSNRIQGKKSENLEQAIDAYHLALQVYTREA
ncbi:MAG: tetratricopeptide repeat protein, partial [Oscillatoriales cyanobacterium C42_A2020_001]|nr:tetratricopeptide repeat protein [Leptolyngbyaceae cyanobacterium C42_A2020_001]